MTAFEDIREIAMNHYVETAKPREIPSDVARTIGQLLLDHGYKMRCSYVVRADSELTVGNMLLAFDNQRRSRERISEIVEGQDCIIGPHYSVLDERIFCPVGIAIWEFENR